MTKSDTSKGTHVVQAPDGENREQASEKLRKITSAHFEGPGCLIEQVYKPGKQVRFEVFKQEEGDVFTIEHLEDQESGVDHRPVEDDLIYKGYLRLPERSVPYGSTAALLAEIRSHLSRYVVLPPERHLLVSHYVLYTWLYDRFQTAPMIRLLGDMGNGKSRGLRVIGDLCYHALAAPGGSSMAAIFRALETIGGGTLVMDELDFASYKDEHREMMRMLRNGFQREGGGLLRAEDTGEGYRAKAFEIFGPKVLAGRKSFPDPALESRCFRIYMSPDVDLSGIPRELPPDHPYHREAADLRNKLLRWRYDNYFKSRPEPTQLPVEPRLFQLYTPLATVTDNPEALRQLQDCVLALNDEMTEDRGNSTEAHVARALAAQEGQGTRRVPLAKVADQVRQSDSEMSNKDVGAVCRAFGFQTKRLGPGMVVTIEAARLGRILNRYGLAQQDAQGAEAVQEV